MTSARRDDSPAAMVKRVDRALYRAKEGGRSRIEIEPPRGDAAETPVG